MSYSLSNAAAACGIYKSTVLRSIKSGRLTATKDALGQWRIEWSRSFAIALLSQPMMQFYSCAEQLRQLRNVGRNPGPPHLC